MAVWLSVLCPDCSSDNIIKHGRLSTGKQRYLCQNPECLRCTFVLDTEQPGRKREVKQKIVEMTLGVT
jgi:transposase-like protein